MELEARQGFLHALRLGPPDVVGTGENDQERWEVLAESRPERVEVDVEVVAHEAITHPGRGRPGTVGYARRVGSLTCFAASPPISTSLVRARRSNSSSARLCPGLPVGEPDGLLGRLSKM